MNTDASKRRCRGKGTRKKKIRSKVQDPEGTGMGEKTQGQGICPKKEVKSRKQKKKRRGAGDEGREGTGEEEREEE